MEFQRPTVEDWAGYCAKYQESGLAETKFFAGTVFWSRHCQRCRYRPVLGGPTGQEYKPGCVYSYETTKIVDEEKKTTVVEGEVVLRATQVFCNNRRAMADLGLPKYYCKNCGAELSPAIFNAIKIGPAGVEKCEKRGVDELWDKTCYACHANLLAEGYAEDKPAAVLPVSRSVCGAITRFLRSFFSRRRG